MGGEKPYRLLSDAMEKAGQVALAKYVMRGKESLVLIRAAQGGLMLHTMYFADEVRNFDEIDKGQSAKIKEGELDLALQLINGLASDTFSPDRYTDEYRHRVLEMVNQKAEGQEITVAEPAAPRAQVIDLMEALKESLAKRGLPAEAADAKKPPTKAGAVVAKAKPAEATKKKAQGGRK
jgi:DNA end-binding protein Ku